MNFKPTPTGKIPMPPPMNRIDWILSGDNI